MTLEEALRQGKRRLLYRPSGREIEAVILLAEPGIVAGWLSVKGQTARGMLNKQMILRHLALEGISLDEGWEAEE